VLEGDLDEARAAVATLLDQIDRTYSRFRTDSELSLLNDSPGQRVRLSPLLARAIDVALDAAALTNGLVDPTVGRRMRAVGYDVDFDLVASSDSPILVRLEPVPGWRAVSFDRHTATARLSEGVELDLGSTGKALAADLAAESAIGAGRARGALVSIGGDVATAGESPQGGWRILATEDSATPADGEGEVIEIDEGSVATSSTTVRRWTRGRTHLHHLLDPRTGLPVVGPWRTVSVVARTCVEANTASTAAIVAGTAAEEWLLGRGFAARLVSTTGEIRRVGAWPDPIGVSAPIEAAEPSSFRKPSFPTLTA
jgi:thiamine biosynthesis lipoprotein ApbE